MDDGRALAERSRRARTGRQVYNTHRFTGRAKKCQTAPAAQMVPRALQVGMAKLKSWLQQQVRRA